MSPIRPTRPLAILLVAAATLNPWTTPSSRAQEPEAPAAAQETPADDAGTAKPKPKPAPKRPAPKPKAAEAEKPGDTKAASPKPADGTLLEPTVSDAKVQWPNGASSVSEAYGDWTMNCNRDGSRTDCVVIQSQGDRRTGKRQFSVELRAPKDGRAEGLILMPFGLQIESGVTFKLDDRTLGKGAPYSYCVADGCLVPISLPTLATDTMKTAQALTVSAMKPDAKEPTVVSVPLSGFAAAFARATAFGG